MYAIIDIETTGGSSQNEKITEIAVFIHDGEKVIDEFQTLIHPEKSIPPFISQMTGITNEMVENAPKFFEIAKKLIELTEGKIIVAHNSAFDYNFIRQEYKHLGYDFKRKTLCTVKLSRKLLPGKKSYSLGKLCSELGISIHGRHRAGGDAAATVQLFAILLKTGAKELQVPIDKYEKQLKELQLNFDKNLIAKLPEATGVYYFYNEEKKLIYIGKSKNIRQRVIQHLSNYSTKKAIEMKNSIADIDFETTGSELVALLKESEEIKIHQPIYNRSQRRSRFNYGLYVSYDSQGYIRLSHEKTVNSSLPLASYSSALEAKNSLHYLVDFYGLCQKLCGLYESSDACFHYGIKKCQGACIGLESVEAYNNRAKKALSQFEQQYKNFMVIDVGKNENEKALVLVENGKYKGFGFADVDMMNNNLELLKENILPRQDNRDVQQIIKNYLKNHKVQKLIRF